MQLRRISWVFDKPDLTTWSFWALKWLWKFHDAINQLAVVYVKHVATIFARYKFSPVQLILSPWRTWLLQLSRILAQGCPLLCVLLLRKRILGPNKFHEAVNCFTHKYCLINFPDLWLELNWKFIANFSSYNHYLNSFRNGSWSNMIHRKINILFLKYNYLSMDHNTLTPISKLIQIVAIRRKMAINVYSIRLTGRESFFFWSRENLTRVEARFVSQKRNIYAREQRTICLIKHWVSQSVQKIRWYFDLAKCSYFESICLAYFSQCSLPWSTKQL